MSKWRQLPSLPFQLFLITVLPLTLLLLLIAFGSLGLHQRAMRAMVGERDERATRAAAAAITEQIRHRQSAIRGVALQAADHPVGPEQALTDVTYLLPDFEGGIALYGPNTNLLATTNSREEWVARAISERLRGEPTTAAPADMSFLMPLNDPVRNEPLMLVVSGAGNYTVVGAFAPETLARRALTDVFGGTLQTIAYLVADDGTVLYQSGQFLQGELSPTAQPGVSEALRGESGTTFMTVAGEEYVIVFSPVAPTNWALVVVEPWRAVTDPLLRATELAPLVLIPILVIALVALSFGVRQVVQPLQALAQKATRLGWGDFAAIEEPVGGINEIRRLQTELIHMAEKVQQGQQSLRGYLGAMTTGQEEERRRLARELHDDTMQSLIALNQQIQLAQLSAQEDGLTARLAQMGQMAEQTVADLRRLTRDLRPIYLEDLGLIPALEMLARDMAQIMRIPVAFDRVGRERRLSAPVELAFYRIAQEALNNVNRHAAAARVTVTLHFTDQAVKLTIEDDGIGFITPESPAAMAPAGHFGLLGVQERAEAIGARLSLVSAPGQGTYLAVSLENERRKQA